MFEDLKSELAREARDNVVRDAQVRDAALEEAAKVATNLTT